MSARDKAVRTAFGSPVPPAVVTTLALVLALVMISVVRPWAATSVRVVTQSSIGMFDDDSGQALFDGATLLAPGQAQATCIGVTVAQPLTGDTVTMAATNAVGSLADHLILTVEVGSGGGFRNCAGFAGSVVWAGTLSQLSAAAGTDGIATGWAPASAPTRTFKITAVVDSSTTVQGSAATADLVWRLVEGTSPPGPSTGSPSPSSPQSPSPSPSQSLSPSPSSTSSPPHPTTAPSTSSPPHPTTAPSTSSPPHPTSVPSTSSPPYPTAAPSTSSPPYPTTAPSTSRPASSGSSSEPGVAVAPGGPPRNTGAGGNEQPRITIRSPVRQLQHLLTAARLVVTAARILAVAAVQRPQVPGVLLMIVLLFLLVQGRIDRRDPKLALAAHTHREAELTFPDPFGPARKGRHL